MRQARFKRLLVTGVSAGLMTMGALVGPAVTGANGATTTTINPANATLTNTYRVPWGPGNHLHKLNPFYSAAYCYAGDISFQQMMYRPGYYFGLGKSIDVQPSLSAFGTPSYSDDAQGNTSVTFTVKPWRWTDGNKFTTDESGTESSTYFHSQVATARDAIFWLNMDKALSLGKFYGPARSAVYSNPAYAACGYVPGMGLPDAVTSVTAPNGLAGDTVTIKFAGHQNNAWLLANELSQIQPMPRAWDTAGTAAAATFPTAYAGSAASCASESWSSIETNGTDLCSYVYGYLKSLRLDDTLWHWANGPYRVGTIGYTDAGAVSGNDVQLANLNYDGPVKAAAVQKIVYVPETDTTTEISQCKAGTLDACYVTPDMVGAAPGVGKAGPNLDADIDARFKTVGRTQWAVSYWQPNYGTSGSTDPCLDNSGAQSNSCSWAAMLNQQYFRQAIFRAIDQKFIISHVLNGYAVPTWSAIPPVGGSAYVKGVANKLSFSLANAQKLLTSHGWATTTTTLKGVTKYFINADGGSNIATCRWSVGSVAHPNGCGSAAWPIDNGTSATLSLLYPSGDPTTATQVTDEVGMLAKAGIEINATSDTAVNVGNACFAGTAHWELCWYGGWIYAPDYYPSGETLFGTGAGSNNVGYSSAVMDALIAATTQNGNKNLNDVLSSGDAAAYGAAGAAGQSFVSWSATDLPLIWQPQATGFREQLRSLVGAQPPNPLGDSNPEYIKSIR